MTDFLIVFFICIGVFATISCATTVAVFGREMRLQTIQAITLSIAAGYLVLAGFAMFYVLR